MTICAPNTLVVGLVRSTGTGNKNCKPLPRHQNNRTLLHISQVKTERPHTTVQATDMNGVTWAGRYQLNDTEVVLRRNDSTAELLIQDPRYHSPVIVDYEQVISVRARCRDDGYNRVVATRKLTITKVNKFEPGRMFMLLTAVDNRGTKWRGIQMCDEINIQFISECYRYKARYTFMRPTAERMAADNAAY